ncbi:MAG: hypothetical protein HKL85_04840 [Acidimicrobiaceae bacterium]|nr:hypothetical protein [Acidimicrobiaceae bacterium]
MRPYVVTYSGGLWHTMHALAAYRPATNVNLLSSISCTAVGTCVVGGQSDPKRGGGSSALVAEENHGRWTTPYAVGSANAVESISCARATSCTGVLTHTTGDFAGVATMSSNHHWSVRVPKSVAGWSNLRGWAMSCVLDQCTIVGSGSMAPTSPPSALIMTLSVA